jgi:D-alanine-D-alanine ligase-like ATP-grasp enzyme
MKLRPASMIAIVTVCSGMLTSAGVAAGTPGAVAAGAAAGGTWGNAQEVAAGLNQGGEAQLNSVSCASAGNCSAGGSYTNTAEQVQAFVLTEANGMWRRAEEVPGSAALNQGWNAEVSSVSCTSAGNCAAGGRYQDKSVRRHVFVVTQTNGTWGRAEEVPGSAALNRGGEIADVGINSVSCASAGNCSAGGFYTDRSGRLQAFVVNEANGTWGRAEEVPGSGALNTGGAAEVDSLSCGSAGNCSAGGKYSTNRKAGHEQAFVVSQRNGHWGTAKQVAAGLNTGAFARIFSVSCASAGNCSAGGSYTDGSVHHHAFVVDQTHGRWGTAEEVPGTAALNRGGFAQISSVSCASAGNCSAGGFYFTKRPRDHALVVTETHGRWGTAQTLPGSVALNQGGNAEVISVSCASPGNCAVGGSYQGAVRSEQMFVANETNGTWGTAEEVPGSAALNGGGLAAIFAVSCGAVADCSAGGFYTGPGQEAFVVSETPGTAP